MRRESTYVSQGKILVVRKIIEFLIGYALDGIAERHCMISSNFDSNVPVELAIIAHDS